MKLLTALTNGSLRTRFSLLMVLNSSLALVSAGIALFGYENYQQRETAVRELSQQAGIIAESSTAALSFDDERAAGQTLETLRGDSRLVDAVIYDGSGRPFARYSHLGLGAGIPPRKPGGAGAWFENGSLIVFQPIRLGGHQIGTIYLKSTHEVWARLRRYVGIFCLVLLASLLLSVLVSSRMQRTIVDPITDLSGVARRVSTGKNYAIRAVRRNLKTREPGEVGVLIDSFNEMLAQIENHERNRLQAAESLRESEERYALAARGANDGLWDWKFATGEIYFSPRWNQMLGHAADESWADAAQWFSRIHPSDCERVKREIAAHREGSTPEFVSEYRMRHENGTFVWMLSRGIAVRDAYGNAIRMAGSQTDITEGKVADPLTGLPNRLYFIDRLECTLETAKDEGLPCAVLFLDLDRFKLVNDSLGHAAGDELLLEVSKRLRSSVRAEDREGQTSGRSVVTRLGGDEFAVLLSQIQNPEEPCAVAERILKRLSAPFRLDGRQMFVSVSIGIAMSSGIETPEDLLRNSDTAMYCAKTRGKARYEVFDEKMRERAVARLEVETGLRRAIEAGELCLFYQPEVSLQTQRTIGYEALVRWNHPTRGLLSPGEFIAVAEESDLIVALGRWVLTEACRQMAEWQNEFPCDPPLSISVNVSPRQLNDPGFVEDVARILARTGLNPRSLKLEMTESSIMTNPDTALAMLRQLKQMHIGLEIDDFGTGYSSLSYLQRLPFDTVKIDRSFILEMCSRPENAEIVSTILDLAHSLGMQVVAEGVETKEQLDSLVGLGCGLAQGYYFSKPFGAANTKAGLHERVEPETARRLLPTVDRTMKRGEEVRMALAESLP